MSFGFSDGDDVTIKGDDGTDGGQKIAVTGSRLNVNSQLFLEPNNVFCLDNNYSIDFDDTVQTIPSQNNPRLALYSYTGSGKLFGFTTNYNNVRLEVSLVIDSVRVWEVDLQVIDNLAVQVGTTTGLKIANVFKYDSQAISFEPETPICFSTSMSIEVRANSNNSNRQVRGYWVALTKES